MFYSKIGKMALGSRLRMLSTLLTEDASKIYDLYNIDMKPKWFPVYYFLTQNKTSQSITTIANEIGQSHPSVIKIVREMMKEGLVMEEKDDRDKRKTNIFLTTKGKKISSKIKDQYIDVTKTVECILKQTQHNLWLALEEFEFLIHQKPLINRVIEQKKKRESENIKIVEYNIKYKDSFRTLNEEWINYYFELEEPDVVSLNNPQTYIIDKGGKILVALYNGEPVGVCALIKMYDSPYDYELAKMAVSPKVQGKGIGYILGNAVIEKARILGATFIYLESNTILKPAISLYQKLGFNKVAGNLTPYDRCNIQMELRL